MIAKIDRETGEVVSTMTRDEFERFVCRREPAELVDDLVGGVLVAGETRCWDGFAYRRDRRCQQ